VNISALIDFHHAGGREATLTAVQPAGRFGALALESGSDVVGQFEEKPAGDGSFVNGGFFVCEPSVLDTIENDATVWEQGPLRSLAERGQLGAFRHTGFWQPMDSLNDKHRLEQMVGHLGHHHDLCPDVSAARAVGARPPLGIGTNAAGLRDHRR
jgi:glucose-1-phosphate cytidylyltransferase